MTAPAPSPAEQAVIDRFGIFEPEERMVEEVARALGAEDLPDFPFAALGSDELVRYRRLAAAAVTAIRAAQDGGAEEAVRRVSALAVEYERTPPGTVTRDRDVALDLRAALAPQAGVQR